MNGTGADHAAAGEPSPDAPARALRLAHRGDWRRAPENSLAALTAAMAVPGCDGVEFDVRLSRDGVPVIVHDATLDRVHGHPGLVSAVTAGDLRTLGVATLEDALEALPGHAFLDVELKGVDHGTATADVLRAARGDAPPRAVVSSFEPATLLAMGERLPGWQRWLNAEDLGPRTVALASELGCAGVAAGWHAITPRRLGMAWDAGLVVAAWTVRRAVTVDRLSRLGVVACCVEGSALGG